MIPDKDRALLRRIKSEIDFIGKALISVTEDQFLLDEVLQHAVCMSLITIGECANHLSKAFLEAHPEIAWHQVIGVRNLSAHGYWQLDMRQIWQAVIVDIPELDVFVSRFA